MSENMWIVRIPDGIEYEHGCEEHAREMFEEEPNAILIEYVGCIEFVVDAKGWLAQ